MNDDRKIVAKYARVSTGSQENEQTIESQLDEVKNKIIQDGHILPDENIFVDDGWSGELIQRPDLDRMRDSSGMGKFSALYVYDRGRLSRRFAHQEVLIDELIDKEISFVSLHDTNATTPEEHALQAMQGVFHEYERVKIVERMRRGKLYKARNGIVINGSALYGYKYIKKTETVPTHWEIDKDESKVVKDIFHWFVINKIGINEIINKLSDEGIPTKKGKSKYWTKGPVSRILNCDTYFTGIAFYNKSESIVSKKRLKNEKYIRIKKNSRRARPKEEWIPFDVPIISDDKLLYSRSLELLKYNKKYAQKNRKFDYLLTGKFFCEHGFPMVGDGKQGSQRYYRSSDKVRRNELRTCDCEGVNVYVVENLWWNHVKNIISDDDFLKQKIREYAESRSEVNVSMEQEFISIKEKITKLSEQETKFAQMFAENLIDIDQLRGLIKQVKDKKTSLELKLKNLQKYKPIKVELSDTDISTLYEESRKVLQLQDFSNKDLVLRDLVSKIVLKKGGEVNTWINIPINTQYLEHGTERRDSRSSKCGEVHTF
ncbi:MAG: recombinase family protein [Candidatus Woesebacteria bacterium]|nr:recombinase family protein [Candidatus Woesebacteria bacterium]